MILRFGAHTSTVSFIHAFDTQWYSKEEHECLMVEHFFFTAAFLHSSADFGQEYTGNAVVIDSEHPSAATFVCLKQWIFTFYICIFKQKTCLLSYICWYALYIYTI